ncbi:MAG: CYTH domain-containing protein [Clostridiales bacterium]|nr:CYTH domain-containing protein [Clostridiales bacterium]
MGKHDEYEYKMLLTKEEYDNIRTWAETNYISLMRSFVQVNYYYDTPDFRFQKVGTTIRVRQAGDTLKGTIKKHMEGGDVFHSKEKTFSTADLPRSIAYKNEIAVLQGVLVTERIEISLRKKLCLMLDRSSYLGRADYEVELEFTRGGREIAQKFAEELFHSIRRKPQYSKSERFFHALRSRDTEFSLANGISFGRRS